VGTGEPNHSGDSYAGAGILKSSDGGRRWTLLGSQVFKGSSISGLLVNNANTSRLLASTTTGVCCGGLDYPASQSAMGVYLSTDGGLTWSPTLVSHNNRFGFSSLVAHPTFANTVYAGSFNGTLWRSTDGGGTWGRLFGVKGSACAISTYCRVALATTASMPNYLFAAVANNTGDLYGIFLVDTSSGSITRLSIPPNPPYKSSPCGSTLQCDYDLVMAADPSNANVVYFGGVDMYRSLNGGSTWTDIGGYLSNGIHPDQHSLTFIPGTSSILVGNDGGIWKSSTQGTSWTNLNSGLGSVQFNYVAGSPSTYILGGTQDNGCVRYTGSSSWPEVRGGDGGWVGTEPTNTNIAYCLLPKLDVQKSTDAGLTWSDASVGINQNDTSEFYPQVAMDPSTPGTLYISGTHVYKTTNYAISWTDVSGFIGNAPISSIVVAPTNSKTVYLGDESGNLKVSNNGGSSWTTLATQTAAIADIAVDPSDSNTIYVAVASLSTPYKYTLQGGIWQSVQLSTVSDPVNIIRVNPAKNLFVGTDHGVFYSTDGGVTWASPGRGLPHATINDLQVTSFNLLIAASHGRGVWTVTPAPSIAVVLSLSYSVQGGGTGFSAPSIEYVSGGVQQTSPLTAVPTNYVVDLGTSWSVTNPLIGSSSTERWITNQATAGTATSQQTLVLVYYHQYLLSSSYTTVGTGSPAAPTLSLSSFGNGSLLTLAKSSQSLWADAGSTYVSTNPLAGSTASERWYSSQSNGTVSAAGPLSLTYNHQYLLIFTTTVSAPLNTWYNQGFQFSTTGPEVYGRGNGAGLRISAVGIDSAAQQTEPLTAGNITVSVTIDAPHIITEIVVRQYQVSLDAGAAKAVNSTTAPTIQGDNYWYDSGTPVSLALNGVFGRSSGAGSRIASYSVDGSVFTAVSTTGTVGVLSLGSISSPHSVSTKSVIQYQLSTPTGSVASATSPTITGDTGWYDSGTAVTVSYQYVWGLTPQQARLAATGYSVDNAAATNVTKGGTGTFNVALAMNSAHTVDVKFVIQYYVSFTFSDASGKRTIVPSALQITVGGKSQPVPGFATWLDGGSSFTVSSLTYEGLDLPVGAPQYSVTAQAALSLKTPVYGAAIQVTDFLGIPVSGAQVRMTVANGTVLSGSTGGDGIFVAPAIPLGTFTASISGIGSSTQVTGDASRHNLASTSVLFGTTSLGLVAIVIVVAGIAAFMLRRMSRGKSAKLQNA
jgi:hypothetical protein